LPDVSAELLDHHEPDPARGQLGNAIARLRVRLWS
jgi:hypothetical protein